MICFAYFHLIKKVWNYAVGSATDSKRLLQLQKRILRIMTVAIFVSSCQPILRAIKILTLPSHYILSLMTFMAHNLGQFTFNFSVYGTYKRKKLHFLRLKQIVLTSERRVLRKHKNC